MCAPQTCAAHIMYCLAVSCVVKKHVLVLLLLLTAPLRSVATPHNAYACYRVLVVVSRLACSPSQRRLMRGRRAQRCSHSTSRTTRLHSRRLSPNLSSAGSPPLQQQLQVDVGLPQPQSPVPGNAEQTTGCYPCRGHCRCNTVVDAWPLRSGHYNDCVVAAGVVSTTAPRMQQRPFFALLCRRCLLYALFGWAAHQQQQELPQHIYDFRVWKQTTLG